MPHIEKDLDKNRSITEKLYRSDIIVSNGIAGLEFIKSRYKSLEKNPTLPEAIEALVTFYLMSDLTKDLTPSAMMNVPIKEDLEKAINKVLIKHGLRVKAKA